MQLFPNAELKNFSDCEHGDFVELIVSGRTFSGICIHSERSKREVLVVKSGDENGLFRLLRPSHSSEVLNYGQNWTLSHCCDLKDGDALMENVGSILHTSDGVFMVAKPQGDHHEHPLCRLTDGRDDGEENILYWQGISSRGLSHEFWRIECSDPELSRVQVLASKDRPND